MHYKTKSIKFLNKLILNLTVLLLVFSFNYKIEAQQNSSVLDSTKTKSLVVQPDQIKEELVLESTPSTNRKKIDGVAAVIGDFIVLESDIDKTLLDLKNQEVDLADISRCNIVGRLMENKLYAHHAIQDSLPLQESQIRDQVNQQLAYIKQNLGSTEKVLKFYRKESLDELEKDLFDLGKERRLTSIMQQSVVESVTITPDEVKSFFKEIPKEERPLIGTEIEIAQIVIKPKPSVKEINNTINRLNEFRTDILENGASFATKAVLYSQDPGSRSNGGKYTISRKDPFAKEFKDNAFSLQEGEVSKPFKTDFGYHILTVDKIKGQKVDVRHILLIPEITSEVLSKYKDVADSIQKNLFSDKIKFKEAARLYSDDKKTKGDGGVIINPVTQDTRFELTKIDPVLYNQVSDLDEGEISGIIPEVDRKGEKSFKIMTVVKKYPEHVADYATDYLKIKDLALQQKQLKAVKKWQSKKIADTYIKINESYQNCEFGNNWYKN